MAIVVDATSTAFKRDAVERLVNQMSSTTPFQFSHLGNQFAANRSPCHPVVCRASDSPGRNPFVGPFEGFRRRDREKPRTQDKHPATKKPAESKSEPVTKN
jgi:hypothetical protein